MLAWVTQRSQAEIELKEMYRIAIEAIRKATGISEHMYISGDDLMVQIEYATSHSWTEEKRVRRATRNDRAAINVIRTLYSEMMK